VRSGFFSKHLHLLSNIHMLLPRKQKTYGNERLTPYLWRWKAPQREEFGRSKTGPAQFAELSKLSAKMIELSLQEAQRDSTLRGAVPNSLATVRWPFLGTSADAQRHGQLPVDHSGKAGTVVRNTPLNGTPHLTSQPAQGTPGTSRSSNFAVLYSRIAVLLRGMTRYWNRSVKFGSLGRRWEAVQKDRRFAIFRARILRRLTVAAQHTDAIRQRTAFLLARWSRRTAKTLQFLIDRITAKVKILTLSKPLQRLEPAYPKLRMLMARASGVGAVIRKKLAKDYRCRDCGRKVGFRSPPRNLVEGYILPLFLMRPVRCTECFRRDYRSILTPVCGCSSHQDETVDHNHRKAA